MPSARRVSWAKFRVSAVCLVAILILGTLVYLLTGGTLLEAKATLYLYVRDATGIGQDSPVRVDGIGIGKVKTVQLTGTHDPNRVVRIVMTVEKDRLVSISSDSYAQLSADTLIGDKFVDISSGKAPSHIEANGEITFKDQVDLMKSLDLSEFEKQLRQMDAVLTDIEQGKSRVGQFILGDDMYVNLIKYFNELEKTVRESTDRTNSIGQALYSDAMYKQISDPIVALDKSLAQIQSGQGSAGQLFRDTAQYQQLRTMADDLRKTIAGWRAQEFVTSDAAYVGWNRSLTSLIQTVDRMNADPMFATSQAYDSLNGFARELRDTMKDFRGNPQKYLRLKVF